MICGLTRGRFFVEHLHTDLNDHAIEIYLQISAIRILQEVEKSCDVYLRVKERIVLWPARLTEYCIPNRRVARKMVDELGISFEVSRKGPVEDNGKGVDLLEVKVWSGLPLDHHLDTIRKLIHDTQERKWVSPCGTIVIESVGLCSDARNILTGYLSSMGCFEEVLVPHCVDQYLVVGGKNSTRIGQAFTGINRRPHLVREGAAS